MTRYKFPAILPVLILSLISLTGLLLRAIQLNHTFISSDNAMLAERIVKNPGFLWMVMEQYGLLISIWVKICASFTALIGIIVNEFFWVLPVAIAGTGFIPLVYYFMKRAGTSTAMALAGALAISALPIHIFQSRYLWGYEIFGAMFLIIAVWALSNFYDNMSRKNAVIASAFCGVYIISHGYFAPFAPVLLCIMFIYSPSNEGLLKKMLAGLKLYFRRFLWLGMLIMLPLTIRPLIHMFAKKTKLGFYLLDYIPGFVNSTGIFITLMILAAIIVYASSGRVRSKDSTVLLLISLFYLAPIIFGTPAGTTVATGYMLISIVFLVLFALAVFDRFFASKRLICGIILFCLLLTLWGDVNSIFFRGAGFDISLVRRQRGEIYDPGTKAAGYYIQKYMPASGKVFAMHRNIEEPNMYYYFRRKDYAFDDLSKEAAIKKFNELKSSVDAVICSADQIPHVEAAEMFTKKAELVDSSGRYAIYIYAKPPIEMPYVRSGFQEYNLLFDKEYSWNREILSGFLSHGERSLGQIIEDSYKKPGEKKLIREKLRFLY